MRTCTSDGSSPVGQWNGTVLNCTATCPNLILTNGMISYSPDTTPRLEGTVATHSCDVGYVLSNGTQKTCQSDRTWSGGSSICEGGACVHRFSLCTPFSCTMYMCAHCALFYFVVITCPPLPDHLYGNVTYSTDNTPPYLFGTQAMYETVCSQGYERSGGDDVRTCTGNGNSPMGVWNGTAPSCRGIISLV